ncbi:MAG: hypothetical protein MJZ31_08185 [Bacteroidales bacterium]|nr:hypothetical protein [Bacteroidales bacterium]
MQTTSQSQPTVFNPIQLQLLEMFSHTNDENTLVEVKQLLSDYFASKAEAAMDNLWDLNQWDDNKNEAVLNSHLRTPYEA